MNEMTIIWIAGMFIGLIIVVYISSMIAFITKKPKYKPLQTPNESLINLPKKKQSDEIMDTLDWMKSLGIIDTKEYNTLVVKCLPHLK